MIVKLYIDEIDAWISFGVFVVEDGYKSLVQYPALKNIEYNSWPEEDGIEVDLSAPVLDAKKVRVDFCCVNGDQIGDLFELLQDGATHVFNFAEIGKTYSLRLASQPQKKMLQNLELFSLEFTEDLPFEGYTYAVPIDLGIDNQGYAIDGKDFSDYGFIVTEGTKESILKAAEVKNNLTINLAGQKGQVYDDVPLYFKEKDVTISLAIIAPDLSTFWTNYEALLYDLIKVNERTLHVDYNTSEYPCYYKNSDVKRFSLIGGSVWCEFSFTLCVTSFRRTSPLVLLAAEDGSIIITEDEYAIDLRY